MRAIVKIFKVFVAYVSAFFAVTASSILIYYWGHVVVIGEPPSGVTINHDWSDALFGVFLIYCCVRVWYMWRKG